MKCIVDTNVLFTFFWKSSAFSILSQRDDLQLFSPAYALEEIEKYESEIIQKAKLTKEKFQRLKEDLALTIHFMYEDEYASSFKNAAALAKELPEENREEFLEDIDFIALSLKMDCPLWTHDKLLRKQSRVHVLGTKEIITLLSIT